VLFHSFLTSALDSCPLLCIQYIYVSMHGICYNLFPTDTDGAQCMSIQFYVKI